MPSRDCSCLSHVARRTCSSGINGETFSNAGKCYVSSKSSVEGVLNS